ncbi:MAG: type II secretion system F family protein [Candidatus Omnitrophica bacterium]|nr:type II secretion system F family protein [Candidatus Omnitrophota bacterium]MCF7891513.1 type II secretion system F family protein [Candidatus Omnitrophota bacterium]MCF7895774.1 type II secretion system F family protein [Candidatus Omnitrophota bacterium]MCF7897375.1 type II secretion system F family protein [Candidatus Omnitrophota bacterium]MCF7909518.1 type II secretion system F family protein [Candidatus Omnitrophota bacterium]
MPRFNYKVKNKSGDTLKDSQEAISKAEMISRLRREGYFIISISEEKSKKKKRSSLFKKKQKKRQSVKLADLTFLARNLATTLSSGITLLRGLELVSYQSQSGKLESILKECSAHIRDGLSLAEAIAKYPKIFSQFWLGIVKVGESSGNLPFVLNQLADYLEMRMEFERKIQSALVYPVILSVAAVAAVFVFLKFIFPKFGELFESFDIELPALTQWIFSLSKFVEHNWFIIFAALAGAYFVFRNLRHRPEVKKIIDRIIFKIPIFGNIIFLIYIERFTSIVHIMLESGLTLVYTLDITADSIGNTVFQKKLRLAAEKVREGGSLSEQLSQEGIFPLLVSEMSKIGEETGTMPDVFKKVSDYYLKELSSKVESLVAAFEPIMIVVMGITIGILVIALFLPLFKLSSLGV